MPIIQSLKNRLEKCGERAGKALLSPLYADLERLKQRLSEIEATAEVLKTQRDEAIASKKETEAAFEIACNHNGEMRTELARNEVTIHRLRETIGRYREMMKQSVADADEVLQSDLDEIDGKEPAAGPAEGGI